MKNIGKNEWKNDRENSLLIITFNRFKYLCEESGAAPASVGQQDQIEIFVLERLGQDVEGLHLHEDQMGGQAELGDVEERSLVWTVDIPLGVCHQEAHIVAVLTHAKQTDVLLKTFSSQNNFS